MTEELLGVTVAAEVLNGLMPEKTPHQWITWLTNNRNQSRTVPYRIPTVRISGGVFYRRAELEGFAELEKSRQLGTIKLTGRVAEALRAFGIGEQGGGTQGRLFKGASVNLQVSNKGGDVLVQTIINEPLTVFAMTPDQAVVFGKDLIEAGLQAKRINDEEGDK